MGCCVHLATGLPISELRYIFRCSNVLTSPLRLCARADDETRSICLLVSVACDKRLKTERERSFPAVLPCAPPSLRLGLSLSILYSSNGWAGLAIAGANTAGGVAAAHSVVHKGCGEIRDRRGIGGSSAVLGLFFSKQSEQFQICCSSVWLGKPDAGCYTTIFFFFLQRKCSV